jgi:hypothetical protein
MASGATFLAYYRPSDCSFGWASAASGTPALIDSRTIGRSCHRYQMPLPGLYDDDTLTDLVTYDPKIAKFQVVSSQAGYHSAEIGRQFSNEFVAGSSGSAYGRSGAVPVTGLYRSYRDYFLGIAGPWVNRLGLGLWQPWSGRLAVMWDPVGAGTTDFTCPIGGAGSTALFSAQDGQVPFGSLGTNFLNPGIGSPCSRPAVYTPRSALEAAIDTFSIASSPTCQCSGTVSTWQHVSPSATSTVRRVFTPVSDMDGDGYPDLLRYDADTGSAFCFSSSGNFITGFTVGTIGEARAVVL